MSEGIATTTIATGQPETEPFIQTAIQAAKAHRRRPNYRETKRADEATVRVEELREEVEMWKATFYKERDKSILQCVRDRLVGRRAAP